MQDYVARLQTVIERGTERLLELTDTEAAEQPAPSKWSPKEVIGHLIDSASNNHQRFVRSQFQDDLVFPGYDQDAWVSAQRYRVAPWEELVSLWRGLNLHLAHVMASTPESERLRERRRHNLDQIAWQTVAATEPVTLDYFMSDYVGHLEHHLDQVLGPGWWDGLDARP